MHDGNDFSSVGWYNTHNGSNRYFNYKVIVNTSDITLPSCHVNYSHIFPCNTTISSAVNQESLLNILLTGDIVHVFGHVHLSVSNTIYVDLWWRSGVWFSVWCLIKTRLWFSVRQKIHWVLPGGRTFLNDMFPFDCWNVKWCLLEWHPNLNQCCSILQAFYPLQWCRAHILVYN